MALATIAMLALAWTLWLGPEFARGRDEQAAVNAIDGVVATDTTWTGAVLEVHLDGVDGGALTKLSQMNLPDLASIKVTNSKLSDDDFATFLKFSRMRSLDLSKTPVSVAGVTQLCKLRSPMRLNLRGSGVEFAQVERLEKAVPGIDVTY